MTQSDNSSNDTAAVAGSNPTSSFSLEQYYREKLANVRQQLPSYWMCTQAAPASLS